MKIVKSEIHYRRSMRLKNYDYTQSGAYFITVCTQNRESLFGEISNEKMILNVAGQMVRKWWNKLPGKYENITLDEFIVMPNHFHGIINIVGAIPRNRPKNITDKHSRNLGENMVSKKGENMVSPLRDGLGRFVSWFKRMTTNEYIQNVKNNGWQPFDKKLWQQNYYEHIIRNENGLNHIREYIINNPLKWDHDMENPIRKSCRGDSA